MTSWLAQSPRNRLYAGLAGLGTAGAGWLALDHATGGALVICPFKLVTGIACPACGSTRAVQALLHGEDVLAGNPLGLVTLAGGLLVFALLCRDLLTGSDLLFRYWKKAEQLVRQPAVAAAGISMLGANWLWAIARGL